MDYHHHSPNHPGGGADWMMGERVPPRKSLSDGMMMFASVPASARSSSVPNVPPMTTTANNHSFDFGESHSSTDEVHHSLPNLHFDLDTSDNDDDDDELNFDTGERLYQSAPNLGTFSPADLMQASDEFDYTFSNTTEAAVPSTIEIQQQQQQQQQQQLHQRLGRMDLSSSSSSSFAGGAASQHPAAPPPPLSQRLPSTGLVSSLETFGRMELDHDPADNPFEPIPIHHQAAVVHSNRNPLLFGSPQQAQAQAQLHLQQQQQQREEERIQSFHAQLRHG